MHDYQQGIALSFAHAGASTLVLVSRSFAELDAVRDEILARVVEAPPKVITHIADVTSEESVEALFKQLAQDSISVDVLVNNAGV